jgi:hypothetical protein
VVPREMKRGSFVWTFQGQTVRKMVAGLNVVLLFMSFLEIPRAEGGHGLTERQTEFLLDVVVCAWCKPGSRGVGSTVLSHGICPRHLRKMLSKGETKPRRRRKQVPASESGPGLLFNLFER